jgi:hypothetical protein
MKHIKKYSDYFKINEGVQTESLISFIRDAFFEYSKDKIVNKSYNDVRVRYKMMTILNRYLRYDETDDYIKEFILKFKETIKEEDLSPVISFEFQRPFNVWTYQKETTSSNGGYDYHGDKSIYIHLYEMNGRDINALLSQIKSTLAHEVKHFVDDILSKGKYVGNQDDLDYFERPYEINARLSSLYSNMDVSLPFEDIKSEMIDTIRQRVWDTISDKDKKRYTKMTYKMYHALKDNEKIYNANVKSEHDRVSKKKAPIIISTDSLTSEDNEKVLKQLDKDLEKSFIPMLKKYGIKYSKPTSSSPHIIEIKSSLTDLVYFDMESGDMIYPLFKLVDKALNKGYVILMPYVTPDQLVKFEEYYPTYNIKEVYHRKKEGYTGHTKQKRYWLVSIDENPDIPRSIKFDGDFNADDYSSDKAKQEALKYSKGKEYLKFDATKYDETVSKVMKKGSSYIKTYIQTLIDSKKPITISLDSKDKAILNSLKPKGKYILTDNTLYIKPSEIYDNNMVMNLVGKKFDNPNIKTNILTFEEKSSKPKYVKEKGDEMFEYACKIGSLQVVKNLAKAGYDLNNISWDMVIESNNQKSNYDIVEYLISKKVDVNKPTKSGWSALMCACNSYANYIDVTKLLLDNGADPNFKHKSAYVELSPLTVAENPEIIELLKRAGANG